MFFGISENVKRRRIISMFLPPLFLRHCRYSDSIQADIFAKVRDLTKRHETQQSSPKPSKWWVGGQERGPKMAHLGSQIHKISSFKPCAVPGNILLLVTGMTPRRQQKRVSSIFGEKEAKIGSQGSFKLEKKRFLGFVKSIFKNLPHAECSKHGER